MSINDNVYVVGEKSFDISEYDFSSKNVGGSVVDCGFLNLYFMKSDRGVFINRQDAIAIAKALGVTGEDLL